MIDFVREALGFSESVPIELLPFEGRGSDRDFYRLKWSHQDLAILIHYNPRRVENRYYADIATFLRRIEVSVPRMIRHDPNRCLIVMEDLGDTDLWSLRKTPWETRRPLYEKTIAVAHRLHSFRMKDFPSSRVRIMEGFGPNLFRWERTYFRENFVSDVCSIKLDPPVWQELETELIKLAERLSGTGRCLVHRDLQSQNVMIRDEEPFLIDFQGMCFGTLFYDLGSLLCDPYVEFSENEREELLAFYYGMSRRNIDWEAFRNYFWEASAQRLMQALGAYGFLGLKKGLRAYLDHIPAGLRHLHLATTRAASLPRLRDLCAACEEAIHLR